CCPPPRGCWPQREVHNTLYSGELGDPRPAGKSGSSLAIRIDKDAARQIFEQMERDTPNLCPSEPGERMR
ncbi:hypothetical protein ACFSHV_05030, partial [Paracidovorax cattleyae]